MTLLANLEEQVGRAHAFRSARAAKDVDEAARPAVQVATAVAVDWARLQMLATLPTDFVGDAGAALATISASFAPVFSLWDDVAAQPSVGGIGELQQRLSAIDGQIREATNALVRAAHRALDEWADIIEDGRFLKRELAVRDAAVDEAERALVRALLAVRQIVDHRGTEPADDWEQARDVYERTASPRACLSRAQLGDEVSGLVARLLRDGTVPLDSVSPAEVEGLRASPALARLCRLTLPRKAGQ